MDAFISKSEAAIKLALQAINGIPNHTWYLAGAFLASGVLASVVIAVLNYRHKYKTAEKYAKSFVGYILTLVTGALVVVDYYLTNSQSFLPFLGAAYPTIYMFATKFYQFGGSQLFAKVANTLGQWANGKTQTVKPVFTTNPSHAVPSVSTTDIDDDVLFS